MQANAPHLFVGETQADYLRGKRFALLNDLACLRAVRLNGEAEQKRLRGIEALEARVRDLDARIEAA